jgi:hypothetical protein
MDLQTADSSVKTGEFRPGKSRGQIPAISDSIVNSVHDDQERIGRTKSLSAQLFHEPLTSLKLAVP